MPKFKLEDFLLPHEHDGEGKKLDEPKELDIEQLRKYVYGLLTDKEKAQDARETAESERDQAKDEVQTLRRESENEDQRRQREQAERDKEIEDLRKRDTERRKIEALEEAFPDATAARLKRLAKRVTGDEKDWVTDAKELVEDGFKISDEKKNDAPPVDDPDDDTFTSRPKPRRSNGQPATTADQKPRSIAEELDAAGVGRSGW